MVRSLSKDKRGDATDPLIVLVILIFLAVSFIVVLFVNTKISEIISTTALIESDAGPTIVNALDDINANAVQQGFVVMFGLLVVFIIVSAFLVKVHPIFIFLYIFFLMATIFVAVFVGNFYQQLSENEELAIIIEQQPMINNIMENIVMIIMAVGGLSMLIVFSKIFDTPIGRSDFG